MKKFLNDLSWYKSWNNIDDKFRSIINEIIIVILMFIMYFCVGNLREIYRNIYWCCILVELVFICYIYLIVESV